MHIPGVTLQLAQPTLVNLPVQDHQARWVNISADMPSSQAFGRMTDVGDGGECALFGGWGLPLWHFAFNRSHPNTLTAQKRDNSVAAAGVDCAPACCSHSQHAESASRAWAGKLVC